MSEMNPQGQGRRSRGMHLLDIVPGKHRPKLARNGAIFVVITAIFLYILYTKPPIPLISSSGHTVKVNFKYAADVSPGRTPVRVKGVDVGVVTKEKPLPGNQGIQLTLSIKHNPGFTIKSDATAALRWRTLLGLNYYVDLTPGSTSAPPLGSAVIQESHTSSQVELDQVLEPLNAQGRKGVQTTFDQLDTGFGDPTATRGAINSLGPAMNNLASGLPAVRGTDPGTDLPRIITNANKLVQRLSHDETNLGNTVVNGDVAVGVTAADNQSLGGIFANAPDALTQTNLTMKRLQTTLNILNPIAQKLEPGAKELYGAAVKARTAVRAARPLLIDLKPTLRSLKPSVVSLAKTAKIGVPVINGLNPTIERVNNTFIPWLNQYSTEPGNANQKSTGLKNYENVGPTLAGVDAVLDYGDQFGTLAGFHAGVGENLLSPETPCNTFITDPNMSQKVACTALTQIISNAFSGTPITQQLRGSSVPENLVKKVLGLGSK